MQNHGLPWPLPWPSPIAVTFRPWAQIQIQMQKADTNTNTYSNENTNRLTSTTHQAEPCRRLHSVLGSKWPAIKIGLWVMNNLSTPFPQNLFHLKVRLQAKVGIGINLGFQPKEHGNATNGIWKKFCYVPYRGRFVLLNFVQFQAKSQPKGLLNFNLGLLNYILGLLDCILGLLAIFWDF